MSDFETCPVGTMNELQTLREEYRLSSKKVLAMAEQLAQAYEREEVAKAFLCTAVNRRLFAENPIGQGQVEALMHSIHQALSALSSKDVGRDIEIDQIASEKRSLQEQVDMGLERVSDLAKSLGHAEAVIDFYADKTNWKNPDGIGFSDVITTWDLDGQVGGRRARAYFDKQNRGT